MFTNFVNVYDTLITTHVNTDIDDQLPTDCQSAMCICTSFLASTRMYAHTHAHARSRGMNTRSSTNDFIASQSHPPAGSAWQWHCPRRCPLMGFEPTAVMERIKTIAGLGRESKQNTKPLFSALRTHLRLPAGPPEYPVTRGRAVSLTRSSRQLPPLVSDEGHSICPAHFPSG